MMPADPPDPTGGVSIRVASRLTGVAADTLRMWERRYGFPKPERTSAGVRAYSSAEIDRLRLVARALREGYRPGEAIGKPPEVLREALDRSVELAEQDVPRTPKVEELVEALKNDDADDVRKKMRQAVATLGPLSFVTDVAAPLVSSVGTAWEAGELGVRHEHLLAATLSTQLRLLLSTYEDSATGPVVLLTTLPGELHGIGIEMVALYLAMGGATPRLLGVDAPVEEISSAAQALGARAVGISISVGAPPVETAAHLRDLLRLLPDDFEVWLGGSGATNVRLTGARTRRVQTWAELDAVLLAR